MSTTFSEVSDQDREALVDFMFAHAPIMMFPLTNMTRYGLGGDHPRAISAWVLKEGDAITDALTISQEGMVFPCCPNWPWEAAARVIRQRKLLGFIGDGQQVSALRKAVGLIEPAQLDATEPAFLLSLADLTMPSSDGLSLKPLAAAPFDLMVNWRRDYEIETMSVPDSTAAQRAELQMQSYLAADSHRVLFRGETPVAMTGFNAVLPEIVQVGGVYTPPSMRGNQYARVALALHLQEVAVEGVTEAVLSAANPAAARAYEAIGFVQTGQFALVIYEKPMVPDG